MLHIGLIGVGQIGSRHLQSLANLEESATIYLIDPSSASLQIAEHRFRKVYKEGLRKIQLYQDQTLASMNHDLDLAIIATSSDVRRSCIETLLQKVKVQNLILEKFLFQKIEDYIAIAELLKQSNLPTWVNQWISSRYVFRKMKNVIAPNEKLKMEVTGTMWGLGCNCVHFMEYFLYLCGQQSFIVADAELDLIDSKRENFKEFTGTLICKTPRGDQLSMTSLLGKEKELWSISFQISETKYQLSVNGPNFVLFEVISAQKSLSEIIMFPHHSQFTHLLVQQILSEQQCVLPTYEQSMQMHIPFIEVFLDYLYKTTGDLTKRCPIT